MRLMPRIKSGVQQTALRMMSRQRRAVQHRKMREVVLGATPGLAVGGYCISGRVQNEQISSHHQIERISFVYLSAHQLKCTYAYGSHYALARHRQQLATGPQPMIETQQRPLKELFDDANYAWEILESEVKLETSDDVTGEDVSHMLQLYMRGVEKMNSYLDYREAFFKQRMLTLMSRPTVIRTLNSSKSAMGKKSSPAVLNASAQKGEKKQDKAPQATGSGQKGSGRKPENKAQLLHLKQKRREIELRLAYGAEESSPEALSKMLNEQSEKEVKFSTKIHKIVDSHEQRLMNRIKQRKLRTLAAKSQINNNPFNHTEIGQNYNDQPFDFHIDKKQKKEQQNFHQIISEMTAHGKQEHSTSRRHHRSHSPKKDKKHEADLPSPLRKTISFNVAISGVNLNKQFFKLNSPGNRKPDGDNP